MESENKPKRARITTSYTTGGDSDHENRYEKVNYNSERTASPSESSTTQEERSYTGYQREEGQGYHRQNFGYNNNRQSGYNNNRPGSYNNRQSSFNPNFRQGTYNRQNSYNSRQESGYNRQESGYSRQEGGYQQRRNNYQQRPGGYQQGYNNRNRYNQSGFQQRPNYNQPAATQGEDGAENTNTTNFQPRQGGFQPRQTGYRQGGYNNRQGGYNNRQGGYNNRQGGYNNRQGGYNNRQRPGQHGGFRQQGMKFTPRPKPVEYTLEDIDPNEEIRLNKYMSNAGICSRREADEYITAGKVKVNGETVTELGTKIKRNDVVEFDEKVVTPERKCYVLLNKPKDCVTTSDDPNGRLTVLDIVKNACQERIYPVGRLDRNTTGVLLLTNDGDLASKLTHPKYVKKKIYHVWTDKDITEEDMQRIADGIELEDGEIHADAISYVSDTEKNQAGIEIHSGRNRIVRRIFETLGYRVTKLDRVYFAGLTKKNLPRGRWRYLTQEEVNFLRMGSFE